MLFAYLFNRRNCAQAAQAMVTELQEAAMKSVKQLESKEAKLVQTQHKVRVCQLTACHCLLSTRHCSLQTFKRCCYKGLADC